MTTDQITAALAPWSLACHGSFQARPDDDLPLGTQSVLMLGPDEPRFWDLFSDSAEYRDGAPDPLNRWSMRALGQIARDLGGTALYPFGGPPWHPFIDWALRTGRAFSSPVGLLVHDTAGLFVSYRGAIALPTRHEDPATAVPCDSCQDKPCRSACPAQALTANGYDVPACHAHLDRAQGADCLSGCLVRRACPVGHGRRKAAQSRFHMKAFHPGGS